MTTTPPLSPKAARLYQDERAAYRTWTQKTTRKNFAAWNTARDKLAEAVKAERPPLTNGGYTPTNNRLY